MKLNELIRSFEIYTTNEESKMLESLSQPAFITEFNEHERVIIDNLIRKSLVSKVKRNSGIIVIRNEY